jgi:hypothetical protein
MKLFEITRKNPRPVQAYLEDWMFKDREQIERWMKANKIEGVVDDDLEIIASGRIAISGSWTESVKALRAQGKEDLEKIVSDNRALAIHAKERMTPGLLVRHGRHVLLPVQFKTCSDDFILDKVGITSLIGCPTYVADNFSITLAPLINLHGFPRFVGGTATIKTVSSLPNLMTMGKPAVKDFAISGYGKKFVGTLEGIPPMIDSLRVGNVRSMRGVEVCSNLKWLTFDNENVFGLLNLLKLKHPIAGIGAGGIDDAAFKNAVKIINDHSQKDRDILACQEELIDNGLEEYATL